MVGSERSEVVMYAIISKEGILKIIPESSVESYALSRWSDDYFDNVKASGRGHAILNVSGAIVKREKDE